MMLVPVLFGLSLSHDGAQTATAASASAPAAAPNETWHNPVNVSGRGGIYDNDPAIAASTLNDSATVVWESRDEIGHGWGEIIHNSNTSLGLTNFLGVRSINDSGWKQDGNVRAAHDGLGRRHIIYWQQDNSGVCGWYTYVGTDGLMHDNQIVPGSCASRKNTALAVSPNGTVHAFFGWDLHNIFYYRREPNGTWSVQGEQVPGTSSPKDLSAGVTTNGEVFIAWSDPGPSHGQDIQVNIRNASGTWEGVQNLSAPVPGGTAHLASLARDPVGGMRIAWTQVTSGISDDVFYREWTRAGGWSNVIKQVTNNSGNSYNASIAVDGLGKAYITWSDDTSFSASNFKLWFASGQGTTFTAPVRLFTTTFSDSAYEKDSVADHGYAALHVAFSSNQGDGQKETWYTYADTVPPVTPTPTLSPTPCSLGVFSDVSPSDFFYEAVTNLVQHSIMSGYNNCTFRPYNNLTRAQAAKIVVLGSNVLFYTPPTPTFRDVPASDTFYLYIESAVHANVVSGYSCGTNCREFRPGNNVTRGQFAKMIKLAFGLSDYTPSTPTFRDVPASDTFYLFIETVYHNGIVSGYSCGTNCLEFRPGNNITRGQAAKMIFVSRAVAFATPSSTPIVVTNTPTATLFVITATSTTTPVVVTATPTNTGVVVTSTPTPTP
jgi:S-layer family protein